MSTLPNNTILGNLEIIEVYDYYDFPCLFACQNASGQIYISVWIDNTKTANTWLYAPISLLKFWRLRSGYIDLRSVFSGSEDGFVFKVIIPIESNHNISVEPTNCENLENDDLPEEGQTIEIEDENLFIENSFAIRKEAADVALEKGLEIVYLKLDFPSTKEHRAPSAYLGTILSSFQYLINMIGQYLEKGGARKYITSELAEKTEFDVFATSPGSFVIELASSSTEKDIFGNTFAGNILEELIKLLATGSDREQLRFQLNKLKSASASKYRDFIDAIVEAGIDIFISWGSPNPERGGTVEMSFSIARATLAILNEAESQNVRRYTIIGELVAIHKRNKRFEIRDIQGQMKYKGIILNNALRGASTATISEIYEAIIEEELIVEPVTGKEKKEYRLAELTPYRGENTQEGNQPTQGNSPSQLNLISE